MHWRGASMALAKGHFLQVHGQVSEKLLLTVSKEVLLVEDTTSRI